MNRVVLISLKKEKGKKEQGEVTSNKRSGE
jgi:hypothetical protein